MGEGRSPHAVSMSLVQTLVGSGIGSGLDNKDGESHHAQQKAGCSAGCDEPWSRVVISNSFSCRCQLGFHPISMVQGGNPHVSQELSKVTTSMMCGTLRP